MQNESALIEKARDFGNKIQLSAKSNQNILLLCNYGADGIASAALISRHIIKYKGHCEIRPTAEPDTRDIEIIAKGNYDLVVFLDLGASLASKISSELGDRWLLITHDEPEEDADRARQAMFVLNTNEFGYEGSQEACTASVCYYATERSPDSRSAFFALTAALGDVQDIGQKRSLVGLNSKIADEEALTFKEIATAVDILVYSRETLPVHEALACNAALFIQGLTGNRDSCLASLRSAGLQLKYNGKWKMVPDFSEDEKRDLLEAITPHLAGTVLTAGDLVGTAYFMSSEDEYSPFRDARDLALLLNSCGRMDKGATALELCLSQSADFREDAEKILDEYRTELIRSVQSLLSNAERAFDRSSYTVFVGDGIVRERMSSAVCDILAVLNRSRGKVIFVRTTTRHGEVEVSVRLAPESPNFDLGSKMQELSRSTGGIGGGTRNRGSARFSMSRLQDFQTAVDGLFQNKN